MTGNESALAWNGGTDLGSISSQVSLLTIGVKVGREIKGGESHAFGVSLEAGQYARVVIRRQGVDLFVSVSAPDKRDVITYENPAGPQSPMRVSLMVLTPGIHVIEVRPVEKWAAADHYEIELEAVRQPAPEDKKRLAAERKVAEGRKQQLLETEDSRRAAIASYEEALTLWNELDDHAAEASTLQFIAQTYKARGQNYFEKTVESYKLALARRDADDPQAKAYTLLGLAEVYLDLGKSNDSLPHFEDALKLFVEGKNRRGQAAAFFGMGIAKAYQREMPTALEYYEHALGIYGDVSDKEAYDRHEEARTLHAIGGAYDVLGKPDEALSFFERALKGWQETGDLAQEGNTYSSIAKIEDDHGNWQTALATYDKALDRYARGEAASERGKAFIRRKRASTLYNVSFSYATLGDFSKAFELLAQSLALREDPRGKGITLMMTGYVHTLAGEPQKAIELCLQALPLQEQAGDPRRSHTLTVMGIANASMGNHRKAVELYHQALEIQQDKNKPDPQAEAITQGRLGESYTALGVHEEALNAYARARQLWRAFGDQNGEALVLLGMARVEQKRKNNATALGLVKDALAAIEPLRAGVTSQQLRVSYFASKADYYELYIDLLMHDSNNHAESVAAAFNTSERARARSLLDVLAETRVEAGLKSDPSLAALVERFRGQQKVLRAKTAARGRTPYEKEKVALELEISKLSAERDRTEAQIRSQFPRFASLIFPEPLTAGQVQSLLDGDTLLLEFALGEEYSYVWALTQTELQGYALPPRSEIEAATRQLIELLRAGQPLPDETAARRSARMAQADVEYWRQAKALSRTLFGPVATLLKKKRFVVVTDGQLRYLPFAALPLPSENSASDTTSGETPPATLLIRGHEIVNLPSASVLSVLRQTAGRQHASKLVAVFADPIFEKDDPRLKLASRRNASAVVERRDALRQALRDVNDESPSNLSRLPASGQEARDILELAPPSSSMKATGFQANRKNATSPELSNYRIVHFATHGILNEKHPELSGIVLSLYDEQGRYSEEGFLRLSDIYGLNLPVDLVVLSACRTGLGKEVRGEGLIGLTRGFMYAGASTVIASLWKVDDDATAELMRLLYYYMFKEGMPPATALRAAQASMSAHKRWSSPYYWSGFILQGDWK